MYRKTKKQSVFLLCERNPLAACSEASNHTAPTTTFNSAEMLYLERISMPLRLKVSWRAPCRFLRTLPKRRMPVPLTERCLNVTIIGMPNAGKSTLLNGLVGSHLAACTQKSHTTRGSILGVYNFRNIQLAFHDTPGYVSLSNSMKSDTKILRKLAVDATVHSDVVLLVVDAAKYLKPNVLDTFADMAKIASRECRIETILVLNKVDLVENKYELLDTVRTLVSLINGVTLGEDNAHLAKLDTTTFMISASTNDGVKDLVNYMLSVAPIRKWIVPKEKGVTDMSQEERVEEIVLENLMLHTHDEIPYIAGVKCKPIKPIGTDKFNKKLRVDVNIYVNSPSQQRIVVGHQGRTMVKIRQESADLLENIFNVSTVILYIWVKVRDPRKEDDEDEEEEDDDKRYSNMYNTRGGNKSTVEHNRADEFLKTLDAKAKIPRRA